MKICMLCGGVGGARAALALSEHLPADDLTFIVNTGDDFCHLGLEIWPDWDTVVYTLAGVIDGARGWGRADEGTRCMEEFRRLQAPDWFHLGDRDLAWHVVRSWSLGQGQSPDYVASQLSERLGLTCTVLRLSQKSMKTELLLGDGRRMDFQDWFVRHQGGPEVSKVVSGAGGDVTAGVLSAIESCELLLIAPSNPFLSIFPMLAVAEIGDTIKKRRGPTWAISPLIGGKAIKGPLDSLIGQLSESDGQQAIVDAYSPWVQRLFLPQAELAGLAADGLELQPCRTWLGDPQQRAEFVQDLTDAWGHLM